MESRLAKSKTELIKQLGICSVVALVMAFILFPQLEFGAAPFLLLWMAAPLIGQIISRPIQRKGFIADQTERVWLQQIAAGTWGFFERYVNADGIGCHLTTFKSIPKRKLLIEYRRRMKDFIWCRIGSTTVRFGGLISITESWEKNLASWNSLETLHGHHFNWYETSTLNALRPYYVSTVDSGNLAACYLTLAKGIEELGQRPVFSKSNFEGAIASLQWLKSVITATRNGLDPRTQSYVNAVTRLKELEMILDSAGEMFQVWRSLSVLFTR